MMKQLPKSRMLKFAALLAILILLSLPAKALADSFTIGSLTYTTLSDGSVEVKAANKTISKVDIPAAVTYGGVKYGVTSLGRNAFAGCSSLASITIPKSVVLIGEYAFQGCSSLTSITIPNSVTSIKEYAFQSCSSLTSIVIPGSITEISERTFLSCSSLTSITIPNSVTSIKKNAFQSCSSLTSILIPNSVTSIGESAFVYCSSLASITIPESVTSIGDRAFDECTSLAEISVGYGSQKFSSVNGVLFDKNKKTLICYPAGKNGTIYDIPQSVTSIGGHAFSYCASLASITIPEGVTSIGNGTFFRCSSLTSISIPEGVTSIGWSAFSYCSSLTSITIPDGVTSIGYDTFGGCSSLTSITIPEGVVSIGDDAFSNCISLASITIPESVSFIGSSAMARCSSLKSVTCLATTPPTLGNDVFSGVDFPYERVLYVPAGTLEDYKASDWRKYFNIIEEIPLGGIDEVSIADNKPRIVINGNSIEIQNLNDGETISIFTTDGACVYQGKNHSVSLAPNKVYVLRTARGILKFAL